jgi:hypothetical protein
MDLEQLRTKVQRMLTEVAGTVTIDKEGDFRVTFNSANVFIECWEQPNKDGTVRFGVLFTCPLVSDVPVSNELFKWVATDTDYRFGAVTVGLDKDERKAIVLLRHNLLGNDLDASEVKNALLAILFTGDQIDTEIHKRFGGKMFGTDRK